MLELARGGYVVGPLSDPFRIAIYDSTGQYVRSVGRKGSGPGEFEYIDDVDVGAGDSIYIIERGSITVMSPQYELTRNIRLDYPGRARRVAIADDGSIYASAASHDSQAPRNRELRRLWRYSATGETGMNIHIPVDTPGTYVTEMHLEDGTLVLTRSDFTVLRSAGGDSLQALTLARPSWLDTELRKAAKDSKQRPPQIFASTIDQAHVWTLYNVFEGTPPVSGSSGGSGSAAPGPSVLTMEDWLMYAPAVLVAHSKESGALVLTWRPHLNVSGFMDGGRLYALSSDSAQNTLVTIYKYAIIDKSK